MEQLTSLLRKTLKSCVPRSPKTGAQTKCATWIFRPRTAWTTKTVLGKTWRSAQREKRQSILPANPSEQTMRDASARLAASHKPARLSSNSFHVAQSGWSASNKGQSQRLQTHKRLLQSSE